ncbi:hypothetical protein ACFFRR_006976 [Megaselia abdita]
MLGLVGFDYISKSEATFYGKCYTIFNIINIITVIISCMYGMKIGHNTDLKLNSLTFFFLVSMMAFKCFSYLLKQGNLRDILSMVKKYYVEVDNADKLIRDIGLQHREKA